MTYSFSLVIIGCGIIFWLFGSVWLLTDRSILWKLHGMTVADTLGSILIVCGLLLQAPTEWPRLLLSIFSLAIWGTMLGYILANNMRERNKS